MHCALSIAEIWVHLSQVAITLALVEGRTGWLDPWIASCSLYDESHTPNASIISSTFGQRFIK